MLASTAKASPRRSLALADREMSAPIWAWSPGGISPGEVDYVGGISKCGDRRVRTLLYEAANVMLTRYNGQLKLKDWALAIARRSTMRKARVALARASRNHHARDAAERNRVRRSEAQGSRRRRPHRAPARSDARKGADDGVDFVASGQSPADCVFNLAAPRPKLTPSSASERAENAGIPRRRHQEEPPP